MAMEEEIIASLALHVVVAPVLRQLEQDERNIAAVQTLRSAFRKAERNNPGLAQGFVAGVLEAEGVSTDLPETLLRLACYDEEFQLTRQEPEFLALNEKAQTLKVILSRIPDQIKDRSRFLQTIKDIASAIRELLDALNEVMKKHQQTIPRLREYKKSLETHKRVFVKSSKSFSDTLKRYFKDEQSENVFLSANRLINQTNALLAFFISLDA